MSGLEQLGIAGGDHLREALTNCSDPLAAIEEFQKENGVILPSLQPVLPFLDLFGVTRLEFHQSVFEELREKLLSCIAALAQNDVDPKRNEKLSALLDKSFPVIKNKMMRPIVLCLMKNLPVLKNETLAKILEDRELYMECATEVKRQIWQDNQSLFGDEVSPFLTQYIHNKDIQLFSPVSPTNQPFFSLSPKSRRQDEIVVKVAAMIGSNVKLYDMVLQFLRTLFLRTRNTHYCTLRAELLMALHDNEVNEICSIDPCHKFTWCIDACIREKSVDSKRARELQGFLDGIRKGQEQILGDLTMILCDPFAMHTVALSLIKCIQNCVANEKLPRDDPDSILLLRMLALGLDAWNMMDSQSFKEPRLEVAFVTKYVPVIAAMMADDRLRSARLHTAFDEDLSHQQPEVYSYYIRNSPLASVIAMYYVLHLTRLKQRSALINLLPTLLFCDDDRAYEDTFLHTLITDLIAMTDSFSNTDFCSSVFGEFLLPNVSRESVHRHTLLLLSHVYHVLSETDLTDIMDSVQPTKDHSEVIHKEFTALKDKIASHKSQESSNKDTTVANRSGSIVSI